MQTTPVPSVPVAPSRSLQLPLVGASYGHVLRTPRSRWWNPLLSWVVAALLAFLGAVGPMVVYGFGAVAVSGDPSILSHPRLDSPGMTLTLNLSLALLIPAALAAVAIGHPVAARFLHSVEGRVRWRWLLRCLFVLFPMWIVYVGAVWVADGSRNLGPAAHWPALLAITLLLTPFQAAGEEYLFRGFVLTSIGGLFRSPVAGTIAGGLVSVALFAAAHGSTDPWILLDLGGIALACVFLAWRTGGLEAGVAVHVVNNVVVGVVGIATGTVSEGYIDSSTTGTPEQALVSLAVSALATALLTWQARRVGVTRVVPATVGALP